MSNPHHFQASPVSPEADQSVLEISGRSPLRGQVKISGAKNSALVILTGALLCSQDCRLRNIPQLADIHSMTNILTALGVKINRQGDVLDIDARHISRTQAPYELVSQLRASFFAIGPLLARLGSARVPLPVGVPLEPVR